MYFAECPVVGKKCTAIAKYFRKHGYMDSSVSIIESGGSDRCYFCDQCSGWQEDECFPPCCDPNLSQDSVKGFVVMRDTYGKQPPDLPNQIAI